MNRTDRLYAIVERLRAAAEDDKADIPILFRGSEIEAARVAWQRLGGAADDFRAHAYIRVLTEEVESPGSEVGASHSTEGTEAEPSP